MTTAEALAIPAAAPSHARRSLRDRVGDPSPLGLLTVYVVLMYAVPSQRTIAALGSMGRPATLWGLACLGWWLWNRLIRVDADPRPRQPVLIAFTAFLVAIAGSYVHAQAAGLPGDEVSPADGGLLRALSWTGVVLLANDGITTRRDLVALLRRIAVAGGLVALLGLLQFVLRDPIIDRIPLPGLTFDANLATTGVETRGGFTRASATATHALEYAAVLAATVPLSIALAVVLTDRALVRRWWATAAAFLAAVVSMSRSAIIGLSVGSLVLLPGLPRRTRWTLLFGASAGLAATYLLVPGLIGSVQRLFLGVGDDTSAHSRAGAIPVALDVASNFGPLGKGAGTFLPKYYVLDNQIVLLRVELGLIGVAAFAALVLGAIIQSERARRMLVNTDPDLAVLVRAVAAATAGVAALSATFDMLSFTQSSGTLMLLLGLCGAAFNVAQGIRVRGTQQT